MYQTYFNLQEILVPHIFPKYYFRHHNQTFPHFHSTIKKLGLSDGPELMDGINKAIETYGKSETNKYRAVVYYMLTKHFGKESVYG